jgi:Protein tyrosine and serine/threonine kinase/ABC transporter, phosphonate, periplasmic substrate-binding protein
MEVEIHANSLVSQISRREVNGAVYDLTEFGGVIFTRSDNEEINDIVDLKNKRIGVVSIAGLGNGQMLFRELQRARLHHLQDPAQVIFMENQGTIVNAVLRGDIDVGFVRTDQLEQTTDDLTGELADLSLVKLIEGQQRVMQNGELFPFKSSTPLYPEWNLGSLPDVDPHVANAVSASLLELADHASVGLPLQSCLELRNCTDTDVECVEVCFASIDPSFFKSCETTSTTALLAAKAMEMGEYAGWRSSMSYIELFMMQLEIGYTRKVEGGAQRCIRTTELADAVTCPVGYSKPSNEEIKKTCEVAGLDCYGYSCVCSPCSKESVVEVFPVSVSNSNGDDSSTNSTSASVKVGCEKFSYCGKVPQGSIITYHAVDNMQRLDATFTASLLSNDKTVTIPMKRLSFVGPERFVHELVFDSSNQPLGVILVAIYADDEQIPESPFRMQVVEHDCAAETGSSLYVSDGNGECVCTSGAVEIGGNCVSLKVLLPSIIVSSIVLAILLYLCYKAETRRRADAVWKVSPEELQFDEPPRVIGRGSFGLVLLAEYKNKKVAVKRVLPPKDGSSAHEGSKFTDNTKNADKSPEMPLSNGKRRLSHGGQGGTVGSAMSLNEAEELEEQNHTHSNRPNELLQRRGSQSGAWSGIKFGKKAQVEVGKAMNASHVFRYPSNAKSHVYNLSLDIDYALLQQEFIQEMRQLSALRHQCISPAIGAVIAKNSEPLRIMDYMEMGSLFDLLHNESMVMEGGMILPILRDIAQGLRFLHEAMPQIVHCDLKAQNVLGTPP